MNYVTQVVFETAHEYRTEVSPSREREETRSTRFSQGESLDNSKGRKKFRETCRRNSKDNQTLNNLHLLLTK